MASRTSTAAPTTKTNAADVPATASHRSLSRDASLEYYIKFPTFQKAPAGPMLANHDDCVDHADCLAVLQWKNLTDSPIVLLLGWAGCQDKYLMKYSKIYEEMGLITIRYTAPVENLFYKRNAMPPIGEKIVKLIFDMNFDQHPLIFHVFSNGGAYVYQHISQAIRNSPRPLHVYGTIFDSAPGDRKMIGLYRAISAIYGKQKPLNSVVAMLVTIGLMIVWLFEDLYHLIKFMFRTSSDPAQANPFRNLKDEPSRWPQMFMYSLKDMLIPYRDVERFANHRERVHGIQVQRVCFHEADHVKLYISEPKRYVHSVCTFISSCLTEYRPDKSAEAAKTE